MAFVIEMELHNVALRWRVVTPTLTPIAAIEISDWATRLRYTKTVTCENNVNNSETASFNSMLARFSEQVRFGFVSGSNEQCVRVSVFENVFRPAERALGIATHSVQPFRQPSFRHPPYESSRW
ncbi:MAG: hypothetical protein ACJ74Y_01890 [Bryobacteraceae bacterium]